MAIEVNSGWMKHLDVAADYLARPFRTRGALVAGQEIWNFIGDPVRFAVVVLACGAWFSWRVRSAVPGVVMIGAVSLTVVLEETLKLAVARTPATIAVAHGQSKPLTFHAFLHSFPSGHVSAIGVFLGTAAVCLCVGRSVATKLTVGILTAAAVALIGLLAVYQRTHTFSDVVGGAILTGAILALAGRTLAATMSRGGRVEATVVVPAYGAPTRGALVRAGSGGAPVGR